MTQTCVSLGTSATCPTSWISLSGDTLIHTLVVKETAMIADGRRRLLVLCLIAIPSPAIAQGPRPIDDRLTIELVAREPDVVTPTGIGVDEQGRVWVLENHTHFRPPNYTGPAHDRIRIFDDFDAKGYARRIRTFADGIVNGMGLSLGGQGEVYLATRSEIAVLRDKDKDGAADERKVIAKLDTPGNYPHNGLSGFAFDPLGDIYFSQGENLGARYKLIGSDGTTLSGGGEGGNIFRCRPDGAKLIRVATGFWNPFHLTVDAFGRLFTVDNDPDSRPPCRLLHVIPGGDYGYRFRNGRKGLHPFTAWNGELPGTLPMVAGTGEAPSGIIAYESNGLPPEYVGELLVTSWGDHVVQRFKLQERGASFTATPRTMVQGGEDFRPVGIAVGPDGSVYLSDWVDKSYPLHGKGRIWRIRMKSPDQGKANREVLVNTLKTNGARSGVRALWTARGESGWPAALKSGVADVRAEAVRVLAGSPERKPEIEAQLLHLAFKDPSAAVRLQAILSLKEKPSLSAIRPLLSDPDPFLAAAAIETFGRSGDMDVLLSEARSELPKQRLGALLALRRTEKPAGQKTLRAFLEDPDPGVRRAAIQWVAEEHLTEFEPLLSAAMSRPPVTRELFEAFLAAQEFFTDRPRHPKDEQKGEEYVARVVFDFLQPEPVRTLALRMLRPEHPSLTAIGLQKLIAGKETVLREEAVRTLAARPGADEQEMLRKIAGDSGLGPRIRADAIGGLAHSAADSQATMRLLISLLHTADADLRREAIRSLRGVAEQSDVEQSLLGLAKDIDQTRKGQREEVVELAEQILMALPTGKQPESSERRQIAVLAGSRPKGEEEWRKRLDRAGDSAAGERLFFHTRGPQCSSCHRVSGRGSDIGPDLSTIGRTLSRDKMIDSILSPSKEIAPQFVSWVITTRKGQTLTGIILGESPDGKLTLADSQGKVTALNVAEIEDRRPLKTSIMPDNLAERMTQREFQDLIAFLTGLK